MFQDPTFWFAVSFGLFFLLLGRRLWGVISKFLDNKTRAIANDLEAARRLKIEAEKTLQEVEKKHLEAEKHAKEILEHAILESERLKSEAGKEIDEYTRLMRQQVEERIRVLESQAIAEIRQQAMEVAFTAIEKVITESVDSEIENTLVDSALKVLKDTSASTPHFHPQ